MKTLTTSQWVDEKATALTRARYQRLLTIYDLMEGIAEARYRLWREKLWAWYKAHMCWTPNCGGCRHGQEYALLAQSHADPCTVRQSKLDSVNPLVVRLMGANVHCRTVENVRVSGLKLENVEDLGWRNFQTRCGRCVSVAPPNGLS